MSTSKDDVRIFRLVDDIFICPMFIGINVMWMYTVLNRRGFVRLMDRLSDMNYGNPENFESKDRLLKMMLYFICNYSIVVTIIFTLTGSLQKDSCEITMNNTKTICGLIMTTWMPFDIDYSPAKEVFLIFQFVSTAHCLYLGGCTISSATITTELLAMKIDHFLIGLRSMKFLKEELNYCIRYHKHIIEYGPIILSIITSIL